MKASSKGLEIIIQLARKESLDLGIKNELSGSLEFIELGNKLKREIPFKLKLLTNHREHMLVEHNPSNVYFGDAENFSITIYQNHYKKLLHNRLCTSKFYREGNISIYKNNI
ncbi:MAG: hypothetical protein AABW57_00775 [Nanoarchaeota archaeon]